MISGRLESFVRLQPMRTFLTVCSCYSYFLATLPANVFPF